MTMATVVRRRQRQWPLADDERFTVTLGRNGRTILVDQVVFLTYIEADTVWVKGTIIRKDSGEVGTYRDEGRLPIAGLPQALLARIVTQWARAS